MRSVKTNSKSLFSLYMDFQIMVIFSLYKIFLKNNDTALIMCESKPIFIPFYFILFLSEKR